MAGRGRRAGLSGRGRGTAPRSAALDSRGAARDGSGYIIGIGQAAMFTGIVSAVGRVDVVSRDGGNGRGRGKREGEDGLVLTVRAPYKGLKKGESIAVNGACLTIERVVKGGFTVHVIETTEGRTLFGEYVTGRKVNLERALRAADRLGGHIVQGHVDGVAVVERADRRGDAWVYDLRVASAVRDSSIPQGSITLVGVSLTLDAL